MHPKKLWATDAKFIEYGLRDGKVGRELRASGFSNYLGVTKRQETRTAIAASCPDIADNLTATNGNASVRRNNADVLILSGTSMWNLIRFGNLRHADYVALRLHLSIAAPLAMIGWLLNRLLGRFGPAQLVVLGEASRSSRLLVFRIARHKRSQQARRYIPHRRGVDGFLKWMMHEGVSHAALRWFETLPTLEPGEDLDLLVDDDVLEKVGKFLDSGPGIQPCDLYSVTGLPGSDFRSMPYFPPYLAKSLLAEAVVHRDLCRVPSPRHHFLSMAFHALYHKGIAAGLPHCEGKTSARPEHDYEAILRELANRVGVDIEITMEQLDQHLRDEGWRPPLDYLARLAERNKWLHTMIAKERAEPEDSGLTVFIIRREAVVRKRLDFVMGLIQDHGFSLVTSKELNEAEAEKSANCIRGGNWGRGPCKMSGGPPAVVVVMYDTSPRPTTWWQKRKYPHVSNSRLLWKKYIRRAFNQDYPPEKQCNVVHSSDNGHEALDYIQITMPERMAEIRERVRDIREAFVTHEPVVKTLTRNGRRAKVELIELDGKLAVKKTFKTSQDRFLQREITALTNLNKAVPEIPPLIGTDGNSVVMPYYDNKLGYDRRSGKLLPLSAAKAAVQALKNVYDAGYALLDASVDNILVDQDEGLKIFDFEFLYRYENKPASFAQSYDIIGCPEDFSGDEPYRGAKSYVEHWQPYVGLSLESLLNDPTWLQHAKRCAYYMTHLPRHFPRRIRHYFFQGVSAVESIATMLRLKSAKPEQQLSSYDVSAEHEARSDDLSQVAVAGNVQARTNEPDASNRKAA